jgi:hypothetical protein
MTTSRLFALGAGTLVAVKLFSEGDWATLGLIFLAVSWVVPMWLRGDL